MKTPSTHYVSPGIIIVIIKYVGECYFILFVGRSLSRMRKTNYKVGFLDCTLHTSPQHTFAWVTKLYVGQNSTNSILRSRNGRGNNNIIAITTSLQRERRHGGSSTLCHICARTALLNVCVRKSTIRKRRCCRLCCRTLLFWLSPAKSCKRSSILRRITRWSGEIRAARPTDFSRQRGLGRVNTRLSASAVRRGHV